MREILVATKRERERGIKELLEYEKSIAVLNITILWG
jgi:hypothetical protein